ncbi:MAG: hypothetical protein SFX18_15775 [Pirellulales bacterium]|nr:hypothetical protein [Pirellulales bacterium]
MPNTADYSEPKIVAALEQLDDLVYAALAGGRTELQTLLGQWPTICASIPPARLWDCRIHYLDYALRICEGTLAEGKTPSPLPPLDSFAEGPELKPEPHISPSLSRAEWAIEVISLLFE